MKHNFEERKSNRISHALDQAAKNRAKSKSLHDQAHNMAQAIPFGQPILVGHHSEKRDRRYREKIHNKFGQSFEADKRADYYESRAESIESNTAIFSDDPQALEKLRQKLKAMTDLQEYMKAANKSLRKNDKDGFMKLNFSTEKLWQELTSEKWKGFPHYRLQNNNANINRVKKRIAQLEKLEAKTTQEIVIGSVRLVENIEANRVQIFFPERLPKELYKAVRGIGFIWCRSEGAFQRHLSPYAWHLANQFVKNLPDTFNQTKDQGGTEV